MKAIHLFEFLLLVLLISCRELIDEPYPDYHPVPVVNALLKAGYTLSVNISLAEKLDDEQLGFTENAMAELFVNDRYVEALNCDKKGEYKSTTVVEPLKKYTCKVAVPGYDTITCEQIVPKEPRIVNIEHINIAGKDEEGHTYPAIELTFKNDFKTRTYYEVIISLLMGGWDSKSFEETVLETITDPVILNEGLPMALFSNEIIPDSVYTMHLNYFTGSYSSRNGGPMITDLFPLKVELRQVTEDY
ncbi:MAG: hypothetical protein ACERKD_17895 [Prolixibacteraceae bacterium]